MLQPGRNCGSLLKRKSSGLHLPGVEEKREGMSRMTKEVRTNGGKIAETYREGSGRKVVL